MTSPLLISQNTTRQALLYSGEGKTVPGDAFEVIDTKVILHIITIYFVFIAVGMIIVTIALIILVYPVQDLLGEKSV